MTPLDRASTPAKLPSGTLAELFLTAVEKHGSRLAYRYFPDEGSDLADVTFEEVYEVVRAAAAGLQALGLTRGERVAILSENCLRWALADFACLCTGILDVPIYPTLTVSQGRLHPGELPGTVGFRVGCLAGGEGAGGVPAERARPQGGNVRAYPTCQRRAYWFGETSWNMDGTSRRRVMTAFGPRLWRPGRRMWRRSSIRRGPRANRKG